MDHEEYCRQQSLVRRSDARVKRMSFNKAQAACGSLESIAEALLHADGFEVKNKNELWHNGERVGFYDGLRYDESGYYTKLDLYKPVSSEPCEEGEQVEKKERSSAVVDIDPNTVAYLYETPAPPKQEKKECSKPSGKTVQSVAKYFETSGFKLNMETGELFLKEGVDPEGAAKEFFDVLQSLFKKINESLKKK